MTKWTDLKIPITDDDSGISAHITYKHVRGVVRIIRLSNVVVCLFAFLGNEEDPNFHFRQERERERERDGKGCPLYRESPERGRKFKVWGTS